MIQTNVEKIAKPNPENIVHFLPIFPAKMPPTKNPTTLPIPPTIVLINDEECAHPKKYIV